MKIKTFLFFAVLAFAIVLYTRLPEVVQPSVDLCSATTVFAPSTPSTFLPGICREVHVNHQEHITTTVYDCGSELASDTLIMLHGFPDNPRTWKHQIEPFTSAGYRVIVPTMRGYEPSSQIGSYHITALATDVLCIAEALGVQRYHVMGHDWGAIVGHVLSITNPSKIKSLVSVAVPPQLMKAPGKLIRQYPSQILNSWYMLYFQLPVLPELSLTKSKFLLTYLITSWSPLHNWTTDKHITEVLETFQRPGVASAAVAYYRQNVNLALMLRDAFENVVERDEFLHIDHPVKGRIGVHTLEVTGRSDGCIKTEMYDIEIENMFTSEVQHNVVRLSGGHFVHYEAANDFNSQVMRFFASLPQQKTLSG